MSELLIIFAPYLSFISFFITILINAILVYKGIGWFSLLVANVIIMLVLTFLGIGDYNFFAVVIQKVVEIIGELLKPIGKIFDFGWF